MSDSIPFVDLRQQYALHQDAFEKAMREVCSSSAYILGPVVKRFEERFADYLGVEETVGVASGTDALRLACVALEIGPGSEVLVPANTFIATALAVASVGASVVAVDVDPESFLMDLEDAGRRISDRTRAIIAVHLYGQSVDMDAVASFAGKHGIVVLEDACQSHGAKWKGRCTGSFGLAGCFSFYPAKNLGAFGDGGLVATNDPELANEMRLLRNYGSVTKYIHESIGVNSRLDSLQASVLNVKLDYLDDWNKKRFDAACRYADGLERVHGVRAPSFDREDSERHVFHLFVVQCERRDELMEYLGEQGIGCGIHYPVPIHLHPSSERLGIKGDGLPVAEELSGRLLSLPMFPEIMDDQIDAVVGAVKRFYGG